MVVKMSRKIIGWWVGIFALFVMAFNAHGAGTPAGTVVTTVANIQFTAAADRRTIPGVAISFKVLELLDSHVTSQDAGAIKVSPGDNNVVTVFNLLNSGNGTDSYVLSLNGMVAGNVFDPVPVNIFLDNNGNGTLEPFLDPLYIATVNDPMLAPDESLTIFATFDIPSTVLNLDVGVAELIATSNTGSGPPGTIFPGAGENNSDALISGAGSPVRDSVTFEVQTAIVLVDKTATYFDPYGGNYPMSGATVRYRFSITVKGGGEANNTIFTDPIPANTTFTPGSLVANGFALTDSADTDTGDFGATTPGAVTVNLGDLTDGSPDQTITFDVTID
jgi:uncharacterized repeat protein (TIGR01451 family)